MRGDTKATAGCLIPLVGHIYEHSATESRYLVVSLAKNSTKALPKDEPTVCYLSLERCVLRVRSAAEFNELVRVDKAAPRTYLARRFEHVGPGPWHRRLVLWLARTVGVLPEVES